MYKFNFKKSFLIGSYVLTASCLLILCLFVANLFLDKTNRTQGTALIQRELLTKICGKQIDSFQLNTHWHNETRLLIKAKTSCGGSMGDAQELNDVQISVTKLGIATPIWEITAPTAILSEDEKIIAVGIRANIGGTAARHTPHKLAQGLTLDWSQRMVRSPLGLFRKF